MGRRPKLFKSRPSFFKVLIGDFSEKLRMPPAFIKNLKGKLLSECTLRGPTGNHWIVKVVHLENGLFFESGWQDFVKDHHLEVGDFLIFTYKGGSNFSIKIYDRSACQKVIRLPLCKKKNNNSSSVKKRETRKERSVIVKVESESEAPPEDDKNESGSCEKCYANQVDDDTCNRIDDKEEVRKSGSIFSFESKNTCFITPWRKSMEYSVTIPSAVVKVKGLRCKRSVMLQDPLRRLWTVRIGVRSDGRVDMATGWIEFCRGNKITVGDALIFEFVQPTLLRVHIFHAGTGTSAAYMKRPRVLYGSEFFNNLVEENGRES